MTGVAKRLLKPSPISDLGEFKTAYDTLIVDKNYLEATETGTSQPANVTTRLDKAELAFSEIK
jgi:hypothetical protein